MNLNQIQTCLDAGIITREEIDKFNAWFDSLDHSIDNVVPDELFDMVERMTLYLGETEGTMQ